MREKRNPLASAHRNPSIFRQGPLPLALQGPVQLKMAFREAGKRELTETTRASDADRGETKAKKKQDRR